MGAAASNAKKTYQQPSLIAFGSVRNLTGGSLQVGTDTGFPAGMNMDVAPLMAMSDRRFKDNIVQIDTHPAGFGLYLFDYKAEFRDAGGHGRQFGVMADEVAPIFPDAIALDETGYARVNYDMLGITRH